MTRTNGASTGRFLRRYAPAIAIVAIIAVVVVVVTSGGGGSGGGGTTPKAGKGGLPLTFDEAKAQGKTVNWGPNCDTKLGKVAVPLWYAPPCVVPWKGRDNGGATTPGVTKDTITVAVSTMTSATSRPYSA